MKEPGYITLYDRVSKVSVRDFGIANCTRTPDSEYRFADWLHNLPALLGARDLLRLSAAIRTARKNDRPVIAALGGHVIKAGCSHYINDLIFRGLVTGVAMNGAAAIHDIEILLAGETSEDVAQGLKDGTFGYTKETLKFFADTLRQGAKYDGSLCGLGTILMRGALVAAVFDRSGLRSSASVLVRCHSRCVPCTVHTAIGTDIVHLEPSLDGAALGAATLQDFRAVCDCVAGMAGGVWLNFGSAALLPEVFLKAAAYARNQGCSLEGLTVADFDFDPKYRGLRNVTDLPGVTGISIRGCHEFMIPLLHGALTCSED